MTALTRKAIQHSFGELLLTKPFKQITVKDIADDLSISRNTFYYHYKDIYDLAEDYFRVRVNRIIVQYPITGNEWIAGLKALLQFFQDNKVRALNIYNSMDYVVLQKVLADSLNSYSDAYIQRKSQGTNLSAEDVKNISHFITLGITATIMEWVRDGLKGNPAQVIDRYIKIFGAAINFTAANASELL